MEGDGFFYAPGNRPGVFLPTPSHGGRRAARARHGHALRYFYPRPRMEGDDQHAVQIYRDGYFYPRPRMEGDAIT